SAFSISPQPLRSRPVDSSTPLGAGLLSAGRLVAYIDGGARGNPGPAGFGVRIERPDGTLVEEFSEPIGTATNNVAEYRGLVAALERDVRLHVYRHFVETARAPDLKGIAAAVGAGEKEVAPALQRLADMHAIVLAPATLNIWMAHPFSAVPTPYPVVSGSRTYWA